MTPTPSNLLDRLFAGTGEMATLMRSHDWSQTPLGPVEQWPQSLRTTVSILISTRHPMFLFWGPELVQFYNDGYRPSLGAHKHPKALGQRGAECWAEIWHIIGPQIQSVMTRGEETWHEDQLVPFDRNGYFEEIYFTYSYSPVRDETGGVGGTLVVCTETTQQVISHRRLQTLQELGARALKAKTLDETCQTVMDTLSVNPYDIPFALLYLVDADHQQVQLMGHTGIESGTIASPLHVDVSQDDVWGLAEVYQTGQAIQIKDLATRFPNLPGGVWHTPPTSAMVMPIAQPGQEHTLAGLLVMGISPRRAFDSEYRGFFDLVANSVGTAIADSRAYEAERQRAEALAELDRAKTIFFSNVSHEFRTPLTLMLAPLEDALTSLSEAEEWVRKRECGENLSTDSSFYPRILHPSFLKQQLQVVHRNGRRLLKLVNTLLDFSRIETERMQAVYEPTDLASLTTDLASTFRSLIERAGLSLIVDCPPLPTAIYVDRDMWEKIVLNLLSNAVKFTLDGTITVRLREGQNQVELAIEDTGIGIPADEIPHLFERFYRVRGAQGRSFEGSGIGLSLVQELVKLHGGTVEVTSQVGQGSCITVTLPTGTAHLPASSIRASRTLLSTALGATPYIEEAWRWLPNEATQPWSPEETPGSAIASASAGGPPSTVPLARILVVDDNADMRAYVQRLLEPYYQVQMAVNGVEALQFIRQQPPDLILTDVMMPQLDGLGLLQTLRADPNTRALPVILLSARASEEARMEGLEAGADDYLIKPFFSGELLARIKATLKMAQIRQESTRREQILRLRAEQAQRETEVTFDRLTRLLETMSDAFVALDQDWRITYQNAAAEQINNGKPRGQVIGKTHWEEWPASVGSELEYQYRKAVAEQVPVHFEHHYWNPPVHDVWLEIHAYPSEEGLGIFFRDISDRKRAENALRERERLFTTLAEVSPVAIFRFDAIMNCIYVNARWSELTGSAVEAAMGTGWVQTLHPDDRDRLVQAWQQWGQTHQQMPYQNEGRCVRPDGSVTWFYIQALPEIDSSGETVGYIGVLTDVTSFKQVEAALRDSQAQLQQQLAEIEAIYQSAPIGLNVLDTDLRFVRINERLAEINGLPVAEHLGRTVREVLPELADVAEHLLRPILETGEPLLNVEISGETPAQPGVRRIWLESFLPLKDGDRIIGISTVCEEITDRKQIESQRHQAEEALRRAKAELEVRVAERTLKLQQANHRLQQELRQREQIEQQQRQSEARYRAIIEDQTELIARFTPDSTILFVNEAYCRYFGVRQEDIVGKSYTPIIYEADRIRVAQLVQSMSAENPMVVIENRVINAQGDVRWTQWVNRMLFDQSGDLIEVQAVGRDITELKRIEQALRDSQERLQLALEASGDGIWDWNIATNEVYFSPQYFQMLDYAPDELPQLLSTWEQLIHPDDMGWVKERLAAHLQDHAFRFEFDYRLRTKSGDWKWIADYGKIVAWDEDEQPLRMIGTHRDVNDRKIIEAALRQSEEQRRLALDLTHIGFWDLHIPSGDLTWNNNHFTLLGLPISTTSPSYQDWRNCIHPADVERVEQLFLNSIDTHTDYEAEYRVVHPDGSVHWLMARGQAIYSEQGQPLRSLGVILDISDRKHMEASLQESNRRWRSLLDNVQLAVIELDIHGHIEYANSFFLTLTEYQLEEVLGQNWFDTFLVPSQKRSAELHFQQSLEQNVHNHYQNYILTKSGKECVIAWNNTILRDLSGQPIGKVSIGEDITERYQMERMKAEFVSVVSHELRTPLTSMQAALSLLSEKIIDPASKEGEATIQIATEGTDRLVRLVNDILDLERLESGKVRLEKHRCQIDDLVETAIAQMYEMANQVDITLEAHSYPMQIEADGDRLLQVLTNLLSNAIKFSPNGSTVQLSVELQPSEEGAASEDAASWLRFTIRDQGRGIPADNLDRIFDRFHQVDASDSREKGGTGLGLAICRSIVQQHGGEIWAESTINQGSTFYFTIPIKDAASKDL